MKRGTLLFLTTATLSFAYVRMQTGSGGPLVRTDTNAIQFLANNQIAPGLRNAAGQLFITADSNPIAALKTALATWNAVSTAKVNFLPLQMTPAGHDPQDKKHVFVFQDNADLRSVIGDAVAITTDMFILNGGQVTDSDILFNPALTFSTTGAPGTFDIQAIATHELGHSLGANHTGILGATMFQATSAAQRVLSSDDLSFVSSVYPSSSAAFGTVAGRITASDGSAVKCALLTIIDRDNGNTVGALTGMDGSFAIRVPAGNYQIYAAPFDDLVQPMNLSLSNNAATTTFQPTFLGDAFSPSTLSVSAGATAAANITVTSGKTPLSIDYAAFGAAGGAGDIATVSSITGPLPISSGQSIDFAFVGPGLDARLTDANVRVMGQGISVRRGSVRTDPYSIVGGLPIVRATLDIAPRSSNTLATLFIAKDSNTLSFSGLLVVTPPPPAFSGSGMTNSASYSAGAVSPGAIAALFGTNLGPPAPVINGGFDDNGVLPSTLEGVSVTFDGIGAPLFFVSSGQINLQVPFELAGKVSTRVTVTYNGVVSETRDIPVVAAQPAIYTTDGSGSGQVIAVNQDGTVNSTQNPGARGSLVTIYATGRGIAGYSIATGRAAPSPPVFDSGGFTSTIDGVPARVLFGGWTPGAVGLAQFNIEIPVNIPAGSAALQISGNGTSAQPGLTIAVR